MAFRRPDSHQHRRPGRRAASRRPVRIPPRRTPRDVLAGIAALLALVALVGGVPYALIRLAGPPLRPELRDLDLLTSDVGPETVIAILVLLVWLAWLQLFVCVTVEVYAGIRRVGMPARVPLSGGTQALANRLVSAVLLLFTAAAVAAPVLGPVTGAGAPPSIRPQAATLSAPVVTPGDRPPLQAREVKKVYVVQPPHGRHHESLWEIADKCLGDGRRYPEIFRLNQHKQQPDGSRLRMADLIRPGWVLDMPDDARNVLVVPVDEDRPVTLEHHPLMPSDTSGDLSDDLDRGAAGRDPYGETGRDAGGDAASGKDDFRLPPPALPERPGETTAEHPRSDRPSEVSDPSRERRAEPERPAAEDGTEDGKENGRTGDAEGDAASRGEPSRPGRERSEPGGREPSLSGRHAQEDDAGLDLVDCLAAASLAAAGLLALLGRRRREQLWRRAFGRRVVPPRGDAARAEVAIRLGADAPGSRMLDLGLRLLGGLLAEQGRRPPTIYAVHLSSRGLDLWIHPADMDAPAPWEACDGGQVWRLHAHDGRRIDEGDLAGVPAPYPGLVSLGTADGGRVLVDLEAAQGVVAMEGARTVAAMSALAVELATNRWSDHMRLTLVGFGEELALIAPDRIRVAGGLAEVLPELEERAARQTGDVLTGRIHSRVADPAWTPHYLLSAIRPDEDEARRLALLGKATRTATGYVVAGGMPYATWTWEITDDDRARIDALGFEVDAQLLPRRHYAAVVDLFRTAQRTEGEPLPEPEVRVPDEPPSIEVRILGPIEIGPVPPLEEGRTALAHEMVVYLATHPAGVHPVVLGGVLWPRGVQAAVRDAAVARVVEWLGADAEGRPHVEPDESGRLRLGPEIRSDWHLFQELVRRSRDQHPEAEVLLLEKAVGLVRGPLLSGRPAGRYAWLAADSLEYDVTASVADAAHRLCELRLARGEAEAAVAAARAGLLLAADDEGLWRDLLRAAHATGDRARLRAVADGLRRRATSHPYGGGMAPETEALIDELLPEWRGDAAGLGSPRLA
ncbi:BTAD domain-containing putative transcriptional regulator [Microtetraspora niveoalba]|uniref:BTAD domain-containing putative transcriptional regulator n=1 Tax=Microtetraspora niveoalba TaxID=46175 RepID=UPI000A436B03|nr:BTAD domain-containing putative transcriptional regulator [Microtetraspora niveoalba]